MGCGGVVWGVEVWCGCGGVVWGVEVWCGGVVCGVEV